jgi:hypothetical protein
MSNPTVSNSDTDAGEPGASQPVVPDGEAPEVQAQPVLGSPLCNAIPGSCFPDDPASPQECGRALDAGSWDAAGSYGYSDAVLACRVTRASPNVLSSEVKPSCYPAGNAQDGSWCRSSDECAPGYDCVGAGTCQHYCCAGRCGPGEFCDIQLALQAVVKIPVCMPIHPIGGCDLLVPGCPLGSTCAVVREDGATSCVAIGAAELGQECDTDHCAAGLVCLGTPGERKCYELCHTLELDGGSDCPAPLKCSGGLPLFPDPMAGICQ